MDKHIEGTWEEFEAWIRDAIGSDFRWRIRPRDSVSNRQMIADLIMDNIKRNNGKFPEGDTFIQKI
ncbi:hypothetical protein BMS3Abin09_00634 [bacterium BMS3Abin09]|nr:hypothetical protein BMS3Abin09_00634 [bacterium BMS3Abin09]GBE40484.1 hypothetical protein BMS3Bbin09_00366 [bacterium BMS3Bbin09]HDH33876.1 hypothetical protein [Nitrospirota bacterium]HDN95042.1 hypothetical protein [Nitrospirota bacterium]